MGEEGHLYSLKWNNYVSHVMASLNSMRTDRDLIDVTLSCEGKKILAHKMLLSACSPYFKDLFKENPCQHPVIIFRHIPFGDLTALVQFMYTGEVSVDEDELPSFLQTAEMLEIQGLTKGSQPVEKTKNDKTVPVQPKSAPSIVPTTVAETADIVPEPAQVAEKPKTRSESAASPSRKRRRTTPTRPEKESVQPKEPVITPEFVTSKVKVEAIETDDLPILEEHEFMSYDDGDDDDGDRGENLEYENNDLDGTEVSEGDPSDIQDKGRSAFLLLCYLHSSYLLTSGFAQHVLEVYLLKLYYLSAF
ncbi:protein bric-a-brac 2-like isoform X1 [Neocloeon triangulifer]|uniref:protein bric-a-brac 2-like isoform X1 n=1 Tax=Neocloeon triangulifer TaxID=2078957 RepID=UPI00286EB90A|nr:protein bric-a-brac 2-like isoform X1 [Neocloeon triangulifer]